MSLKSWIVVTLSLLLLGCRATSMMVGVSEPSVANIQLGDHRSKAEGILGKPLWRVGIADGLTYDIYQYPVARSAQPGPGAAGLVVDALTLGVFELIGDPEEFEPVKQIGVAFDGEDRVRFISTPWMVSYPGACKRMRSNLPLNSGIPVSARPALRSNSADSVSTSATLELVYPTNASIDGGSLRGPVVELSAGRHTLAFSHTESTSKNWGEISRRSGSSMNISLDFEVISGRLYRLKMERFYRPAVVFWIEDVDSGEVLQCAQRMFHK